MDATKKGRRKLKKHLNWSADVTKIPDKDGTEYENTTTKIKKKKKRKSKEPPPKKKKKRVKGRRDGRKKGRKKTEHRRTQYVRVLKRAVLARRDACSVHPSGKSL